jgi:KipI family sensor histidine kinase inhibitor
MSLPWCPPTRVADHALRVEPAAAALATGPSAALTGAVRAAVLALADDPLAGVDEVTPGYASILIRFDPLRTDPDELARRLAARLATVGEHVPPPPRLVEVPVCYGGEYGPDLDAVASHCGLSPSEVIAAHSGAEYGVAFLGFAPGFPYLTGLPPRLQVPRRATPRLRVPAGSVAIAAGQAGIYPQESPGGWQLLGRTPLPLLQLGPTPRTRLQLGDRVRFVPLSPSDWPAQDPDPQPPAATASAAVESALTVLAPGVLTTVQDLGRPGFSQLGISVGGAADPLALRLANRLVQNPDGAAGLELTLTGPELRAERDLTFALVGALSASVDGKPVASGVTATLRRGQVLRTGTMGPGLRGYLALRGGLELPRVAGSLATDLRGGFGGLLGRALQRGDQLAVATCLDGGAVPQRTLSAAGQALLRPRRTLRVTWGAQADWFTDEVPERLAEIFATRVFTISPQSNRSGLRLQVGEALAPSPRGLCRGPLPSEGVTPGALQVPADGQPILLGVEQASTGGYPKLAQVVSADLPLLGRLRPGEQISLLPVGFPEAVAAYRELQGQLAGAIERAAPDSDSQLHFRGTRP